MRGNGHITRVPSIGTSHNKNHIAQLTGLTRRTKFENSHFTSPLSRPRTTRTFFYVCRLCAHIQGFPFNFHTRAHGHIHAHRLTHPKEIRGTNVERRTENRICQDVGGGRGDGDDGHLRGKNKIEWNSDKLLWSPKRCIGTFRHIPSFFTKSTQTHTHTLKRRDTQTLVAQLTRPDTTRTQFV